MSAQPLESRIAKLESSVEHLSGAFEQFGKRIDDLRSDINANFARLDGHLGLVEGRLDGRVNRLEGRFQWMIGIQMTSWLTLMLAIFFRH